jgi:hypothetical protein
MKLAPTFPLFVAFIATAAMAPLVFFWALRLALSTGSQALGQQMIKWGAAGALGFALADILLAIILRYRPTVVGASVGALAGFTVLSLSYAVVKRVRARRNSTVAS